MKILKSILLFLFLACFAHIFSQTSSFPTAEGFGKWATGGRGGTVAEVTNLLDDPAIPPVGSLRWAFKQGRDSTKNRWGVWVYSWKPITIVFRVSGIIDLKGYEITAARSGITIAGQTAPGYGICIKGGTINLGGCSNVIIRHIRVRVGKYADGTYLPGGPLGFENGGNFIIDHCSFSWSAEEALGLYDDHNQTVQWCMFTEGLYAAGHPKGNRGYGPVVGGTNTSFHHNLIAHTASRSPRFGCSDNIDVNQFIDFVNNVNFNWGKVNACYGGENEKSMYGSSHINFINNYWKPGPAYPGTKNSYLTQASWSSLVGTDSTYFTKYYMSGNYIEGSANSATNTNNYNGLDISRYQEAITTYPVVMRHLTSTHFDVKEPVETQSAQEAFNQVLLNVGAHPLDTVDRRIIHETRTGTATSPGTFNGNEITGIIDKPEDAGGYPVYNTSTTVIDTDHDGIPDDWESERDLNPNLSSDGNKITLSGYTALEVYLNSLVGENIDLVFETGILEQEYKFNMKFNLSGNDLILQTDKSIIRAEIIDLLGRAERFVSGSDIKSINITDLKSGVYLLKAVSNDNRTSVCKIKL